MAQSDFYFNVLTPVAILRKGGIEVEKKMEDKLEGNGVISW